MRRSRRVGRARCALQSPDGSGRPHGEAHGQDIRHWRHGYYCFRLARPHIVTLLPFFKPSPALPRFWLWCAEGSNACTALTTPVDVFFCFCFFFVFFLGGGSICRWATLHRPHVSIAPEMCTTTNRLRQTFPSPDKVTIASGSTLVVEGVWPCFFLAKSRVQSPEPRA